MYDEVPKKDCEFSQLPQTDDSKTLLSQPEGEGYVKFSRWAKVSRWSTISKWTARHYALGSAFVVVSLFSCMIGMWIGSHRVFDADKFCTRHVAQPSPVLKDLDIHYEVQAFNGSFLYETIYRKPAGPEVDAAWEALGAEYHPVVIPEDQAAAAGITPNHVKINPKYGGGYPANIEGLHHLHCLNLLRQTLYWNYDYYKALGKGAFANEEFIVQIHTTHCMDIIRQQLMCTVDIGVFGQVWVFPKTVEAFVDFNTKHKCRNFEAIRAWAEPRQIPEKMPRDFLVPPEPEDIFDLIP